MMSQKRKDYNDTLIQARYGRFNNRVDHTEMF